MRSPISLIVLTYNEEVNIEHTLKSVSGWIGEIIIIDSFSTDKTLEICRRYTDKIWQHEFKNQATQFNWALDNVPIQNEWIFRLDADELVGPDLAKEICEAIPNLPEDVTGVYLNRRLYFLGRWIKHGGHYPAWFIRIFRKGKGRYEEIAEEHIVLAEGSARYLKNDFADYNRSGLAAWAQKHIHTGIGNMNDMLAMEARGWMSELRVEPALFSTQERRKRWLKKNVYCRSPMFLRAFLYFIYRYVFRLGFLDGIEGLIYHFLMGCWFFFYVDSLIYEAARTGVSKAESAELSDIRNRAIGREKE